MTTQSEAELENEFISRLNSLGYASATVSDEADLLLNLKENLERLNDLKLSDSEFQRILNILGKGNVFERAELLRQKKHHILNDKGKSLYFMLVDRDDNSKNSYEVTNQVTLFGKYTEFPLLSASLSRCEPDLMYSDTSAIATYNLKEPLSTDSQ